jgi:HAMP domain-containing protein
LVQDRDALQKQVCDQLQQLSELRSQVDELTLTAAAGGQIRADDIGELKSKLQEQSDIIELRDREVG